MLNLNVSDPKEQAIANALIQRFSKDHFQKLLIEWLIDANVSFRQPEHRRLRRVFEYLNPSVAVANAHISHDTVRSESSNFTTDTKSRSSTICEEFRDSSTYHLMAGAPEIGTPYTEFSASMSMEVGYRRSSSLDCQS